MNLQENCAVVEVLNQEASGVALVKHNITIVAGHVKAYRSKVCTSKNQHFTCSNGFEKVELHKSLHLHFLLPTQQNMQRRIVPLSHDNFWRGLYFSCSTTGKHAKFEGVKLHPSLTINSEITHLFFGLTLHARTCVAGTYMHARARAHAHEHVIYVSRACAGTRVHANHARIMRV